MADLKIDFISFDQALIELEKIRKFISLEEGNKDILLKSMSNEYNLSYKCDTETVYFKPIKQFMTALDYNKFIIVRVPK